MSATIKKIWSLYYNEKVIYTNTDKPACPTAVILRYWPDIDQSLLPALPSTRIESTETQQTLKWESGDA